MVNEMDLIKKDNDYQLFLDRKKQLSGDYGFEPLWIPDYLFDLQKYLAEWAIRKGRSGIFADCGLGKGQPYGSKILTESGYENIENLKVGQKIISSDGKSYNLKGIHRKQEINTYRFFYSDGVSVVFDEEHLHIVRTNNDRARANDWRVMSTMELLNSGNIRYGENNKRRNYDIPVVSPIRFKNKFNGMISPYVLGVLIGDGCLKNSISISIGDSEILDILRQELPNEIQLKKMKNDKTDYRIVTGYTGRKRHPFREELNRLGLLNKLSYQKHIPMEYLLNADPADRLALLRGLMDSDGYIAKSGTSQYYTVSKQLSLDVLFLVRSLGGVPTYTKKKAYLNGIRKRDCYIVTFSLKTFNPFRIKRKAERWNENPRDNGRWIDRIEYEKKQKTICLSVDSPDNSYLTENMVITHNTAVFLVWAMNIIKKLNKNILILTPLAVSRQTVDEGEKFGIEVKRSRDGKPKGKITVTNYEQLEKFDPSDYVGVVCDESGILKNFSSKTKKQVIRFMSKMPYRLLSTATAAPNDYTELGNSSEALGELTYNDVIDRFFRDTSNDKNPQWKKGEYGKSKYVFKGHSGEIFWRYVLSWARACRKPSDLGFPDSEYVLPELIENEHIVQAKKLPGGWLFAPKAIGLRDQRGEKMATIKERSEKVAELVCQHKTSISWCHLNSEGDYLEKVIPNCIQVSGRDSDESKEEKLIAFTKGEINRLIIKPKIGGFGMNFQHCNHMTCFPSNSYEQYYQFVRRCYRYGQTKDVIVDTVLTEGELGVFENVKRKARDATVMFQRMIELMNDELRIKGDRHELNKISMPEWL